MYMYVCMGVNYSYLNKTENIIPELCGEDEPGIHLENQVLVRQAINDIINYTIIHYIVRQME